MKYFSIIVKNKKDILLDYIERNYELLFYNKKYYFRCNKKIEDIYKEFNIISTNNYSIKEEINIGFLDKFFPDTQNIKIDKDFIKEINEDVISFINEVNDNLENQSQKGGKVGETKENK